MAAKVKATCVIIVEKATNETFIQVQVKAGADIMGLLARLKDNEPVIVGQGYLFEFERRGYLQAGSFVPEVTIEHPQLVQQLHEEYVHAGSDVVEAFTYYAHREKMRLIGRESELENINRKALKIARKVADETNTLMAGNICNSTIYAPTEKVRATVRAIFKEQIEWAVEERADYIIGETFGALGEAMLALECIKEYGNGLPAVITFASTASGMAEEGMSLAEACRRLEEAGASVVGLNCHRGPRTMLPLIAEVREACKGPVACLPAPYRTTDKEKVMVDLTDPETGDRCFPDELDQMLVPRRTIAEFAQALRAMGVLYMGVCCGNRSFYIRSMAEAIGRRPPASKYSPDMSQHFSKFKDDKYKFAAEGFNINASLYEINKTK